MKKVKHKNLILFSTIVNFLTWILWLFSLRHFRDWQLQSFLDYSLLVFFAGSASKWIGYKARGVLKDICEAEWPSALLALHLLPFINFTVYTIYFTLGGNKDANWTLLFLAPFIAGTGLVSCTKYMYGR
jgi:hypothetical protein